MYRRPHPCQVRVRVGAWGGRTYLLTARGPLEPGRHTSGWVGTCLSLRVGVRECPQEVASKQSPDNQPGVMGGGRYQSQHGGQHMEGVPGEGQASIVGRLALTCRWPWMGVGAKGRQEDGATPDFSLRCIANGSLSLDYRPLRRAAQGKCSDTGV